VFMGLARASGVHGCRDGVLADLAARGLGLPAARDLRRQLALCELDATRRRIVACDSDRVVLQAVVCPREQQPPTPMPSQPSAGSGGARTWLADADEAGWDYRDRSSMPGGARRLTLTSG
jgi:hypothetical protein